MILRKRTVLLCVAAAVVTAVSSEPVRNHQKQSPSHVQWSGHALPKQPLNHRLRTQHQQPYSRNVYRPNLRLSASIRQTPRYPNHRLHPSHHSYLNTRLQPPHYFSSQYGSLGQPTSHNTATHSSSLTSASQERRNYPSYRPNNGIKAYQPPNTQRNNGRLPSSSLRSGRNRFRPGMSRLNAARSHRLKSITPLSRTNTRRYQAHRENTNTGQSTRDQTGQSTRDQTHRSYTNTGYRSTAQTRRDNTNSRQSSTDQMHRDNTNTGQRTRNQTNTSNSRGITRLTTQHLPPDRVGKQWVLPRKYVGTSRNSQANIRTRLRYRAQSRPSCENGKVWRRGECRCPYLSQWNQGQNTCECVYGTYKNSRGFCVTY